MNDQMRLLLQYKIDHPNGGCVINYESTQEHAVKDGLLRETVPDGGGIIKYEITQKGKEYLTTANEELGNRATRLVRKLKKFGGGFFSEGKYVVYGWPFEVPLDRIVEKVDDCLVVEDA